MVKKKNASDSSFKAWQGILLGGILLTALILGILQRVSGEQDQPKIDVILNEQTCSISGGDWNACGSACRTEPDAPCIEVCVEYCECEADNQCPFGFSCGDMIEGKGVCVQD